MDLMLIVPAIPVRSYGPGTLDLAIALGVLAFLVIMVVMVVLFARARSSGSRRGV